MVYTDNNPLTYALSTAKLNATGLRWVGELADFNFEIRYRPGKLNTDADSFSRFPGDFKAYMNSCSEQISVENLQASLAMVSTVASGDSIWIASMTDNIEELQSDDLHAPTACNHLRVIDTVKAQQDHTVISHVLSFFQNR